MQSTGTNVCLFREVKKKVNSVVIWQLWMECLEGMDFILRAQNDLHLSMGNSHDFGLSGFLNINEHGVNYIHTQTCSAALGKKMV